jgi:hypothetical protein
MNTEFDTKEDRGRDFSTRVSETAEAAKARAGQMATATAARAREVTSNVGHKVRELAGRIRERSPHDSVRDTTHRVADTLDTAGAYLEEKSLQGMADDLAGIVRRYPLQSLLVGVGIGFLLSRGRRNSY